MKKRRHTTQQVKPKKRESFQQLDRAARDASDLRPLSAELRRQWEAARQTGRKRRPGRPPKDPRLKSRIVPVSIDPALLEEADRFASAAGISRSKLIAEALRLRLSA
jgi:hypothetical protein